MGLFKKKDDESPLQRSVRELEEIDKQLESGGVAEEEKREQLLGRREELETEIAQLRGEAPPTSRRELGAREDEPRPPDVEEDHLTKMR